MKFITKDSSQSTSHFGYKEMCVDETVNTKFLGLQIDNHINMNKHFEQIIPQFSRVCYAIRSVVHISNINTLQSIYHEYIHCYKISNNFLGVTLPTVGRFSIYKIKSPELWLVHNPEPLIEVYLNNYRFCLFHANIYFH